MSTGGGASGKEAVSGLDTNLQQGPFEFGPSQFDQGAIDAATQGNQATTAARYNQLGMGGSTPELQDLASAANLGQATTGQEQTQDVNNPAFNPALQTPQTNIPTSAVLAANQQNIQAGQQAGAAAGQAAGTAAAFA
jgi:hypothetical protein|nr:hypothetical protein [Bradyrhizobium sp.]